MMVLRGINLISLLAVSFQLLTMQAFGQHGHQYRFEHFTTKDGIANLFINGIEQDHQGNWWFYSEGGLIKYNGFVFKNFVPKLEDPNSIPINGQSQIFKLHNDQFAMFPNLDSAFTFDPVTKRVKKFKSEVKFGLTGIVARDFSLWVGSRNQGLVHLDKDLKFIKNYVPKMPSTDMSTVSVNTAFEDSQGIIWAGFHPGGLCRINRERQTIRSYPYVTIDDDQIEGKSKVLNGYARDIAQINPDELWIASDAGLVHFDIRTESFTHYRPRSNIAKRSINSQNIQFRHLYHYKGIIWCGTDQKGIFLFDIGKREFVQHIQANEYNPHALRSNRIMDFRVSEKFPDGVLWINTPSALTKVNLEQKPFQLYRHFPEDKTTISFKAVRTIYKEGDELWIGSDGGEGLNIVNTRTGKIIRHNYDALNNGSIGSGSIGSIVKRPDGQYWITTWSGYLNLYDHQKGTFRKWRAFNNNFGLDRGWAFCASALDSDGNYYLSAINAGVQFMPADQFKITKFFENRSGYQPNMISHITSRAILVDDRTEGIMWFGTGNGLSRYNSKTDRWKNYLQDKERYDLPCNSIISIHQGNESVLWLGTEGCGLLRFDINADLVSTFTTANGLPSNTINAIYSDNLGRLWMSTGNGVSVFDPRNETFKNYFLEDGLQDNLFYWGAHFQDENGRIYFGGPEGLTAFDPEQIEDNPYISSPVIDQVYVQKQEVQPGDLVNDRMPLSIAEDGKMQLAIHHENNDFSIAFSSTHYANPRSIKFKYKLEGYDSKWITTRLGERMANYSNLPPGSYDLALKASNNDGKWAEEIQKLGIKVFPPWWATWWFRVSVILLVTGSGFYLYRRRIANLRRDQKLLEYRINEATDQIKKRNEELQEQQENLKLAIQDTNFVMAEAIESGNFSARIDVANKTGEWRNLGESVNKLFESIISPFEGINEVIEAMALGDLTKRYYGDAKGDIKSLTDRMNEALDQLSSLLLDVTDRVRVIGQSSEEMSMTTGEMNSSTGEISSAIAEMSEGAQRQVAKVDESSKLIEDILSFSREMGQQAQLINETAEDGVHQSENGNLLIGKVGSGRD
ncbi:MAG: hypothetical protein KI790_00400 [Cyclobacteriaceae bacterium]|nr:hypothetical protein [Cyclobacteriaceae bacterium HetDA_MAG_MS6]